MKSELVPTHRQRMAYQDFRIEVTSMLRVCCFCDKVRDDAQGAIDRWQERQRVASPDSPGETAILSYTCCHQCFEADPRANVFRARQSEDRASVDGRSPRVRFSPRAHSWRHSVLRAAS
jgi:hypothetical protein